MHTKLGIVDRVLRLVVAFALLALVFTGPRTAWGWVGIVPLLTAVVGYCPAYRVLGLQARQRPGGGAR
jgi:hypothetical protein